MMVQARTDINSEFRALNHSRENRDIFEACRYPSIFWEFFCQSKRAYQADREAALINARSCPESTNIKVPYSAYNAIADVHTREIELRATTISILAYLVGYVGRLSREKKSHLRKDLIRRKRAITEKDD